MIQKGKSNEFIPKITAIEKRGGLQTKIPLKTQSDFVLRANCRYHKVLDRWFETKRQNLSSFEEQLH